MRATAAVDCPLARTGETADVRLRALRLGGAARARWWTSDGRNVALGAAVLVAGLLVLAVKRRGAVRRGRWRERPRHGLCSHTAAAHRPVKRSRSSYCESGKILRAGREDRGPLGESAPRPQRRNTFRGPSFSSGFAASTWLALRLYARRQRRVFGGLHLPRCASKFVLCGQLSCTAPQQRRAASS